MKTAVLVLALAAFGSSALAQIVVDSSGVRTPDAVIDSHGVHTAGAEVTSSGVRVTHARARSSGISLSRNGVDATMDCHGGAATILGDHNHLHLTACSELEVPGNYNEISVDLLAPATVAVPGNRNHVAYRVQAGGRAHVSVLGTGNAVTGSR